MELPTSNCCGANLLELHDDWGICAECKEWATEMPEEDL